MSRLPGSVRALVARGDDALLGLRDRMTPGQRWTATLLMTILCAVVLYGAPVSTVVIPSAAVAATPLPPPARPPATQIGEVSRPAFAPVVAIPAPTRSTESAVPAGAGSAPTTTAMGAGSRSGSSAPRVTALLPAAGGLPGRDERSIAELFLSGARIEIAAVADAVADDACSQAGGPATLVLAPEVLAPSLVDCLLASGATVLAADGLGTRPGVASTRLGRLDGLRSAGRWILDDRATRGARLGIVGGAVDRGWIEPALAELRAGGLTVAAAAYPADDPAAITAGVRAFADAAVEIVVFAAPVALRRSWSAQHAVISPAVRFLVADVHEGVADETHAPSFDGAVAITTQRGSWYERAHGETPEQTVCRTTWEAVAGRMLAGETRWVRTWCQHVAAAEAAVREAATSNQVIGDALRRLRIPSPLTSELGPRPGGWGPTAEAVVVWRASCGCWNELRPFRTSD